LKKPIQRDVNQLNKSISRELIDSLVRIAEAIQLSVKQRQGVESNPSPLVYAAYYDTALAVQRLLAETASESEAYPSILPRITTLSKDFYSSEQIATIIRWLDIEAENSMSLVEVSTNVLKSTECSLNKALKALELGCPQAHEEFCAVTREIILASSGSASRLKFRGASSFALWGALAINPEAHSNWWDYLATLIHESAHSILFALTRSGPLVLNDPQDRYFSPLRQDDRPMDGIYHAAFVSAREAFVLSRCLENKSLICSGLIDEEIVADLTRIKEQSFTSFYECLKVIREHAKLTPLGQDILEECEISLKASN
jgi:hypothetical protein